MVVSGLVVVAAAQAWTLTGIDTLGSEGRGWWTSMRLSRPYVHIGYAAHTSSSPLQTDIRYALSTDLGRTWTTERVDSAANYGNDYALLGWWRGGLDLDSLGRPHMAYTIEASIGSFCIHAVRTASGWVRDTVELRTSQPLICHDADLKIDSRGRCHVVYTHYGVMTRYAIESDTGWEIHDLGAGQPYGVALALDSADNPHVVVGTLSDLRYAYSSDRGASWQVENVASSWWHVDICLGTTAQPLISHVETNSAAKFKRRDGPGNWFSATIDPGGPNSCRPAIFRDWRNGTLHIAYYPYMNSPDLKHAWSTDNGTNWTVEQVGTTGGVYSSCSAPDYACNDSGSFIACQYPGYKLGIAIDRQVGIEERPTSSLHRARLELWPNPASRFTVVRGAAGAEVQVLDASGRVAAVAPVTAGTGRLDLSALPTGVYLVRAAGQGAVAKLVVRR
jgi:hypothetical protein